jgi:hypothetical protein
MVDFTLWDRKTLENFASEATHRILDLQEMIHQHELDVVSEGFIGLHGDFNDEPVLTRACFGKWHREAQIANGCSSCEYHLACVIEQYG